MVKCILCKKKQAVGITTLLYCKECAKKDVLVRMSALQRDTRFKDVVSKYENECWKIEEILKTDLELSNILQEKCVSFSPEHIGFKEMIEEVKEINETIPKIIKNKIELRKRTKIELKKMIERIKDLANEIKIEKDKKVKEELIDRKKELQKNEKELISDLKKLEKKEK